MVGMNPSWALVEVPTMGTALHSQTTGAASDRAFAWQRSLTGELDQQFVCPPPGVGTRVLRAPQSGCDVEEVPAQRTGIRREHVAIEIGLGSAWPLLYRLRRFDHARSEPIQGFLEMSEG
jgi:hypothetical protein